MRRKRGNEAKTKAQSHERSSGKDGANEERCQGQACDESREEASREAGGVAGNVPETKPEIDTETKPETFLAGSTRDEVRN